MGSISVTTQWCLLGWLIALAAVVLYRCLTGGIWLTGLLAHDLYRRAEGQSAPDRIQLFVMFLFALAAYARLALKSHGASLPEVPLELLVLLAGSQAVYLSGKFTRILHDRKRGLL